MKVFIVPSWYPTKLSPNSGVFFKEQAKALQKFGVQITVAYPEIWSLRNMSNLNIKRYIKRQRDDGVLTYRFKGYNFFPKIRHAQRFIFYSRLEKIFKRHVKEYGKPDIIHAHSVLWGGWASARLAKKYNIPLIITEHSSAYGRKLIKNYQSQLIEEALDVADKILVVGPSLKQELKKFINSKEILVVPNMIDTNRFEPERYNKTSEKFVFFSLAFLTYNKGMDILIKAFAKSFKGNLNVELIIGGDGEERENLETLAMDEGVSKQIHFVGELSRSDVVKYMKKCNVFVLASRYETFGVAYIEALACGKPVIGTKCGGPEMIINKNNGLLIEKNNIEELASALKEIVLNNTKYNPIEIARDCKRKFSEEAVCKRLVEIYSTIIYNKA